MSDRIPHEVWSDILTNPELSIEDIVRCSGVCKSWYSLITSPAFVSLHTQRINSIANPKNSLFLVKNYETNQSRSNTKEEGLFSIYLDDETLSEYKSSSVSSSQSQQFRDFDIINCLMGVVCLSHKLNSHTDDIVLWNPSIRKYLILPPPLEPIDPQFVLELYYAIGFGFDTATNDFKVVRVLDYSFTTAPRQHAEVYELSLGCWRRINNPVQLRHGYFKNQAFLNGAVHWVVINKTMKEENIVLFDFKDEVFRAIRLPDCLNVQYWCVRVFVIGESLSLSYNEVSGQSIISSIWVMKQYGLADSWTKQLTIELSPGIRTLQVVGFRGNGEALVVDGETRALSCYDPNKKYLKRLVQFTGMMEFDMVGFTESLALLAVKGKSWDQKSKRTLSPSSKVSAEVCVEKKVKIQCQ